jgi:hypothetical protein
VAIERPRRPGSRQVPSGGPAQEQQVMAEQDKPAGGERNAATQSPSGGTGGGGNSARDKAPVPTAEAPVPKRDAAGPLGPTGDASGSQGVGSSHEPGGMKPTNERFAGHGRLDTPGASSGPEATKADRSDRDRS